MEVGFSSVDNGGTHFRNEYYITKTRRLGGRPLGVRLTLGVGV